MEKRIKVGDIVTCIDNESRNKSLESPLQQGLELNRDYVVKNVIVCKNCGKTSIAIRIKDNNALSTCCSESAPKQNKETSWFFADRFIYKN